MKINYIYIDGYKNLDKIELSFDDNSTVNALIGNNGSGKSNVIEALTKVFTSVYSDSIVNFIYEIHYMISEDEIVLSNKEKIVFLKNNKSVKKSEKEACLPRSIFLYYCGETDRLQKLALDCQDKKFDKALKTDGEIVSKYLSCVGLKEFTAALLANAIYQNATYDKVCELISIDNIGGPITFNLKRPSWSKSAPINDATIADNVSLSPNSNSAVEMTSFSLTIGITCQSKSVSKALSALGRNIGFLKKISVSR